MYNIEADIERVLISSEQIKDAVQRIAGQIDSDYGQSKRRLLLICILKGSLLFTADLVKQIKRSVEIDFLRVSSYRSTSTSPGELKSKFELDENDLSDTDVIIVEDIVDTGNTASYLTHYLTALGAHSIKIASLLDKPSRRKVRISPDYFGFVLEDEFVVGYGLDYDEEYRALPYIGILKPYVYST